jgi:hypothetical protein
VRVAVMPGYESKRLPQQSTAPNGAGYNAWLAVINKWNYVGVIPRLCGYRHKLIGFQNGN